LRTLLLNLLIELCCGRVAAAAEVDFDRAIAPLLAAHCLECHNPTERKGKFDLTTAAGLGKGGESGEVVVPGKPQESILWEYVRDDEMPPKKPLKAAEKALLKAWIEDGAKWGKTAALDPFAFSTDKRAGGDFWSLRPVRRPAVPPPGGKNKSWVSNPIDAFVLAKLEAKNLSPAPAADPRVLIRRVYFDLIGLPPTPREIDDFVAAWERERRLTPLPPREGQGEGRAPDQQKQIGSDDKSSLKESVDATLPQPLPRREGSPEEPPAYERLIDRLLASPHYGERWARHWLDVARFTESQGFEYDRFRPSAWHYRDYVIRAFNSDKPYDAFIREQIAGDVMGAQGLGIRAQGLVKPEDINDPAPTSDLGPGPSSLGPSPESIIATSLLVCGPWDQAGNAQANVTQKMITREEELEDLVSVIGQTFLGLTVNCARCHTHKFDPITHEDYFRIKSVFEGVKHGERVIASPAMTKQRNEEVKSLQRTIAEAEKAVAGIEEAARRKAGEVGAKGRGDAKPQAAGVAVAGVPGAVARWTFDADAKDSVGAMHGELVGGAMLRGGRLIVNGDKQFVRTAALRKDIAEKTLEAWVALPTLEQGGGGVITLETSTGVNFDSIVFAERQARKWMAGSAGFRRTKDLQAPAETAKPGELVHMAIVYAGDHSIAVYRNGQRYAEPYTLDALRTYKAGDGRVVLGMRHTDGGKPFFNGEIDAAALYDRALSEKEIAALFAAGSGGGVVITEEQMLAAMTAQQREEREAWMKVITATRAQLAALPPLGVAYVGLREQPKPTRRLLRGDVKSPAEEIAPGGLSIIKSPSPDFGLKPDAPEAERRVKLAQWIADARHPLTARVMVNRLWHYHFGRGIVETPNDFGFSGGRPTHPELLDWLAAEFTDGSSEFGVPSSELKGTEPGSAPASRTRNSELGTRNPSAWSLKRMHKLILMSAAYRQSSAFNEQAAAVDADNTLLWRYAPRRLEGEIVRDAMLAVSGQLNDQLGGPSFKPFTVSNHGSDFYHLKDMIGPDYNRRTIYRAHVNSGKSAMMDALDCPDPSIKTPARRVTTTPLAALALMNNSFVQRQAKHFAERAMKEAGGEEAKAIALVYRMAFGRTATAGELKDAAALTKEHGLTTLCWVLLNATEFLYVN